jgi:hypothetical protein
MLMYGMLIGNKQAIVLLLLLSSSSLLRIILLHIDLLKLNKESGTQEFSVYILNYYILGLLVMESTEVFCVCS